MQEYIDFLSRHPMLSAAWVGLLGAWVFTMAKSSFSKVKNVAAQEAVRMINKEDAVVVDVRGEDEFRKGHIANAIHLPLAEIKNNQLSTLEKHKDAPIIVVCNAGVSSVQAAQMLVSAGFGQVFSLQGGMTDWKSANLLVVRKKR
ncbi:MULTISPECIES: rhodanese-like domain-containing protein [Ferrimonas]|uniref:Rhodanese-related sulfurtransferase n=1 Tax=Ferrimonas sediminum TaxID=718193 RepID=A0A1G8JDK1_9GAMM|nr:MULTISPECIES: rhodanese-like domain-containing protein [Ferrimonas]USD39871.1 rhodanese-like domain-containing protein [Ferrimonas sp. SCSIO 43195]SDI29266.1 Rhodanese-related sulfurtransferase [Ferrimonas sediminum]